MAGGQGRAACLPLGLFVSLGVEFILFQFSEITSVG